MNGLREMVDLYRERLTDADWRYQELMEQFKTMTKALPMAPEEPPRPETPVVALPMNPGRYNWQPNRPQQAKGAGPAIS